MKTMINVALPKGRLGEKVYAMFEKAGFPCPSIKENNRNACVFMKYYDTELCLPRIKFEDAAVLNKSGIFRNFSIKKMQNPKV